MLFAYSGNSGDSRLLLKKWVRVHLLHINRVLFREAHPSPFPPVKLSFLSCRVFEQLGIDQRLVAVLHTQGLLQAADVHIDVDGLLGQA